MGSSMDVAIVLEVGRHKMPRRTVEYFRRVGRACRSKNGSVVVNLFLKSPDQKQPEGKCLRMMTQAPKKKSKK